MRSLLPLWLHVWRSSQGAVTHGDEMQCSVWKGAAGRPQPGPRQLCRRVSQPLHLAGVEEPAPLGSAAAVALVQPGQRCSSDCCSWGSLLEERK